MVVHILDWLRPRKEREEAKARRAFAAAFAEHREATERQDTRRMSKAAADLRAARHSLMRVQVR